MSTEEHRVDVDQVRVRIVDWLLAEGWHTTKGSGEGAAWALRGQDPGGKIVIFAQESQSPHRLLLHASVRLDDGHRRKLDGLERARQEELCWTIRMKLLDMRVDFQGVSLPLEQVDLRMRLYAEDLTRSRFFDTVGSIQNAMLFLIWTVRRALDQPAVAADGEDLRVN